MVEFLGETRSRSRSTFVTTGPVYTMSNGYYEELDVDNYSIEDLVSDDYWHKKPRADGSLPATDCVIGRHWRDPLRMNRNTLTFRFSNHAVEDTGSTSVAGLDAVRPPKGSAARSLENAVLTAELLARTNPFRPEFSIPVSLKELVDVSTLFKIAANGFAQFAGSAYLNYKFGWQQFYNDVRTLVGITKTLESRIRELQSLSKRGGVRRKVFLRSTGVNYLTTNNTIQSTWGVTIKANTIGRRACKTYGTVRWRMVPGYDIGLTKLQYFNTAVSKIFDLGAPDSQTLWNLVPWSWLVDYFVDLNSFFGANVGKGIIEPYDICIVRKSSSTFHRQVTSKPSSISLTGSGRYGRTEYARDVTSRGSYPPVGFDLLNANQILIIAALIASFKR